MNTYTQSPAESLLCGSCSTTCIGAGAVTYNYNGRRFCTNTDNLDQCIAVQGTLVVGGAVCTSSVTTIAHHQACYEEDIGKPIAVRAFDGTPEEGDCREAADNEADKEICRNINPVGSGSNGDFTAVLNGACAVEVSCAAGQVRLLPEAFGQAESNNRVVGQCVDEATCETVGGRADISRQECGMACPDDEIVSSTGICQSCGTNQAPNDAGNACVCDMDHTDADTGGGLNCQPNTAAAVCDENQAFAPAEDPHLKQHANCTEDRRFAIRSNPMQACGLCSADAFENCPSPEILYAYEGLNFCGPESQCIAVAGTRSDGTLCCPSGEGHFGSECRAPNSSMECRTLNAQEPIFENNACRAATADTDCTGVFSPDLPIRAADGSCRLPADNTECDSASSGAEPIYAESEPDNCRIRAVGDCPQAEILTGGECQACPETQRATDNRMACRCLQTHIDVNAGTAGADLDCRVLCQGGQIRDDTTRDCRPRTGMDCLMESPPEILSGTSCQSCTAPEVPNDLGTSCICPTSTHEEFNGACVPQCDPDETRVAAGTCEETVDLSSCAPYEELEDNACAECDEHEFRGTGNSCAACPITGQMRAMGVAECSCPQFTETDGSCTDFAMCNEGESRNPQTNECIAVAACMPPNRVQEDNACEPDAVCDGENQIRIEATNDCDCAPNHADSDTSTPELTCTPTPECGGDNQRLDTTRNICACEQGFTDRDDAPETLNCEMIPMCNAATEVLDQEANECVPRASCVLPDRIQETGECEPDAVCDGANQIRIEATNECDCMNGFTDLDSTDPLNCIPECVSPAVRQADDSCAENRVCDDPNQERNPDTNSCRCEMGYEDGNDAPDILDCVLIVACELPSRMQENGECEEDVQCPESDETRHAATNECVCANDFEGEPGSCTACIGEYVSTGGADCACPASQSFDFGDGVCDVSREGLCEAPRTYNMQTNACDCPQGQRPTADGSACEAVPVACLDGQTRNDSGECVCPEGQRVNSDQTACEMIPASGGGGGGGGGGAAVAIIAVPVVLIGGYYLLGGFGYVDPYADFSYSGENGNLSYRGDAGFNLQHDGLRSYASAIQSNGAVSYESGISYEKDYLALTYSAAESDSEYLYDLRARLNYGDGPWSISPTADAEFQYRTDDADWNAEASAGVSAAWTSHKWNVRAHSAFAGDLNHGLDVKFRF